MQRFPFQVFRFIELIVLCLMPLRQRQTSGGCNMIILLAPPRSGSTLTYQLLCHSIYSRYLSNLSHMLYKLPLIGELIAGKICKNAPQTFRSEQGFVGGLSGPAEGMHFWTHWYGGGLDELENFHMDPSLEKRTSYLKRVLAWLGKPERPVITGYLGHTLCVERLIKDFPDAIFVRLNRDPIDNALSIIACSEKSESSWFSVRPAECAGNVQPIEKRVVEQVFWIRRRIDSIQATNVIDVEYEDICNAPEKVIDRVIAFANTNGGCLTLSNRPPTAFAFKEYGESKRKALVRTYYDELLREHAER